MIRHPYRLICGIALAFLAIESVSLHATEPRWNKQSDVMVAMPDSVNLAADIYLPPTGNRFPTIFMRTPYDKKAKEQMLVPALSAAGYAVVLQDVRGMNASQGTFIPFVFEKTDGLASLEWISRQSWCDGRIGMWGSSYPGFCALLLAPEDPPNLKAIFSISGWGNAADLIAPGGALHLMLGLPWCLSPQILGKDSFASINWKEAFRHLPVSEIPSSMGLASPAWSGILALSAGDRLRKEASITDRFDQVRLPILHVTGWNDFVARHTLDVYSGIDRAAKGARTQELVVGPWRHDQIWTKTTKVGDEDFGPSTVWGVEKTMGLAVKWFDRHVKGQVGEVGKPVRLFVMGVNEWREFDAWPPRNVESQKWYFHSDAHANGASGDGRLSTQEPATEGRDQFVFDPLNPVPTLGGVNFHFFPDNLGVKDQRPIEQREDVLVYTSQPLEENLTIIGPLSASIFAASEGKQTDFTVKLVEVRADGYARIIEEGIRRGPDPVNGSPAAAMVPTQTYRFSVDLGATAIAIPKGNRLRVEVSSSSFPKYTRNPNTGATPETATEFVAVKQTVFHSPQYPSHFTLPVAR